MGCEIPEREAGIRAVGKEELHRLLVLTQDGGDQRGEALGSRVRVGALLEQASADVRDALGLERPAGR